MTLQMDTVHCSDEHTTVLRIPYVTCSENELQICLELTFKRLILAETCHHNSYLLIKVTCYFI